MKKIIELKRSLEILCPSTSQTSQTFSNAWRPIRGQCVLVRMCSRSYLHSIQLQCATVFTATRGQNRSNAEAAAVVTMWSGPVTPKGSKRYSLVGEPAQKIKMLQVDASRPMILST